MSNFYEERRARKLERLEGRAEATQHAAEATIDKALTMAARIPFGQPILVGHHSEGRDRRYRNRIDNTFRKGFETLDKARDLQQRVESFGTSGIASDDPEAVVKLRAELAALEAKQEHMKRANAAIRKHAKFGTEALVAGLVSAGFTAEQAEQLAVPDRWSGLGFPSYALSNNNANIRRVRARIAELSTLVLDDDAWSRSGVAPDGTSWEMTLAEGRYDLEFSDRCDDDVRRLVRSHGFVWAPSRKVWTRKVTKNAAAGAARLARLLGATDEAELVS